jgi:flagellar protein FlaG
MLIQNINGSNATPPPAITASEPVAVAETKVAPPPRVAATESAARAAEPTPAQVQSAVDSINKSMRQINSDLEFTVDKDTQKRIIKVVEAGTGTVIRQFPSEEAIAIARAIDHMQNGLLLKQKA